MGNDFLKPRIMMILIDLIAHNILSLNRLVHPKENGKYFNKILFDIVGLKCTIFAFI